MFININEKDSKKSVEKFIEDMMKHTREQNDLEKMKKIFIKKPNDDFHIDIEDDDLTEEQYSIKPLFNDFFKWLVLNGVEWEEIIDKDRYHVKLQNVILEIPLENLLLNPIIEYIEDTLNNYIEIRPFFESEVKYRFYSKESFRKITIYKK